MWFSRTGRTLQRARFSSQLNDKEQIASAAINGYIAVVASTLTIRNLDDGLKQKFRLRAAGHQRSMVAGAREIMEIWKDRYDAKSTNEIMMELRGDDCPLLGQAFRLYRQQGGTAL